MKKLFIAFFAAALLVACNDAAKTDTNSSTASTTEIKTDTSSNADAWVSVDSATAMQKMTEAGTPGEQHKLLAKDDGKWTANTSMWTSLDASPMVIKSVATNKMILGGRYQETSFKCDFMGIPYEGTGTTGYDNTKKVFFIWAR